jgi:hypothetical protein
VRSPEGIRDDNSKSYVHKHHSVQVRYIYWNDTMKIFDILSKKDKCILLKYLQEGQVTKYTFFSYILSHNYFGTGERRVA